MENNGKNARHVYGGKAALTIEPVMNSRKEFHTVMLEIAPVVNKEVQWNRKVTIQPTYQELPLLAALFLGYNQAPLKLQRPGKWMEIVDQQKSVFVKGGPEGGGLFPLPVMPGDRVWVAALLLQEYSRNFPDLEPAFLIASLQTVTRAAQIPVTLGESVASNRC